jgi:hypothetical protein
MEAAASEVETYILLFYGSYILCGGMVMQSLIIIIIIIIIIINTLMPVT